MSTPRANAPTIARSVVMALAATLILAAPARSQYPFGPGFAYPGYGYGGYGYGAYGYGGFGYGGYGYPGLVGGFGYGPGFGWYGAGYAVAPAVPTYGPTVGGLGYATPYGGFGAGYGAPGFGPSGVGFANPLFSLGLSPLAVQNAVAERALLGRPPGTIGRAAAQRGTPMPNPTAPGAAGSPPNPQAR